MNLQLLKCKKTSKIEKNSFDLNISLYVSTAKEEEIVDIGKVDRA